MGRATLVVTRPRLEAADRKNDSLFTARAALRRAINARASADAQIELLRDLVARLEAERGPNP
jgi:hypothetical protein